MDKLKSINLKRQNSGNFEIGRITSEILECRENDSQIYYEFLVGKVVSSYTGYQVRGVPIWKTMAIISSDEYRNSLSHPVSAEAYEALYFVFKDQVFLDNSPFSSLKYHERFIDGLISRVYLGDLELSALVEMITKRNNGFREVRP